MKPNRSNCRGDETAGDSRDLYAFPNEGHGFARPENRLAFYGVAEKFLADTLGGRTEPLGSVLKNPVPRYWKDPWVLEGIRYLRFLETHLFLILV